jgi:ABC-type branched-subunit amino acid transport system ATPase component
MELLELVGLADESQTMAGRLSFGSKKLVDIARAMVSDPALLLLDEPSSGVDRLERESLARIICDLQARSEISILVVEHHMDLVRAIASHVLALQGGKTLMHGTPHGVLDSEALKEAFVGGGRKDETTRDAEVAATGASPDPGGGQA